MATGDAPQIKDLITTLQLNAQNTNANLALLTAAINNKFPNWVTVPPTATSPGVAGQVAYAPGFLYVAVGSNVWQRVALSTF